MQKLLIICGQEGVGKSTLAKRIVPHIVNGAAFDAENILQVNPFEMNDEFERLAVDNSAALINNFFQYGYNNVIAGSFIRNKKGFDLLKEKLPTKPIIYLLMLTATKPVRDERRLQREKKPIDGKLIEWMKWMDIHYPPDATLKAAQDTGDYTYFEIDNTALTVEQTIEQVREKLPEFFRK